MTEPSEIENRTAKTPDQATMVPAPDLRLRVRPAEFARIIGVSRQAVAKAVKAGRIRVDADGRVDPQRATRDWIARTHPASMRARALRDAAAAQRSAQEQARHWRAEAEAARQALAEAEGTERERARAIRTACRFATSDAMAGALPRVADDLARLAVALAERHTAERLRRAVERGTLAALAYRAAWRALSPALAGALAEDCERAAAPVDPAAAAPLFADHSEPKE